MTPPISDPADREKPPRVVVAIPCYNEAAAIASVIQEWRAALPDAEIAVFDNNSGDGTGSIADVMKASVVDVPEQGKGWVVRAIFERFKDHDAVIMIDGDGTYSAANVETLLNPVLSGKAALSVGVRRPVSEPGAMSPVRGFGNLVIGLAFRLLIGPGTTDLLSGYRIFGPKCLRTFDLRSTGFEIETELATEAVARGLKVFEAEVIYRPRIAGTSSKLRAFRDGSRILRTIVKQSLKLRPRRFLGVVAVAVLAILAIVAALTDSIRIEAR